MNCLELYLTPTSYATERTLWSSTGSCKASSKLVHLKIANGTYVFLGKVRYRNIVLKPFGQTDTLNT